jgi:dihydroorotate dehydrogenase (NAD+) catalytic subunit
VIEMMMAGATAVALGSENLINPYACRDVILALPGVMARLGIDSLRSVIGAALSRI